MIAWLLTVIGTIAENFLGTLQQHPNGYQESLFMKERKKSQFPFVFYKQNTEMAKGNPLYWNSTERGNLMESLTILVQQHGPLPINGRYFKDSQDYQLTYMNQPFKVMV